MRPQGTVAAGCPVRLKGYVNAPQERIDGAPGGASCPAPKGGTGKVGVSRRSNFWKNPRIVSVNAARSIVACTTSIPVKDRASSRRGTSEGLSRSRYSAR